MRTIPAKTGNVTYPIMFIVRSLVGQMSFHRMVRPKNKSSIQLSLEEIVAHLDLEVLIKVDANNAVIVGNPQVILGQQFRLALSPK
jgi:hypothetical protein